MVKTEEIQRAMCEKYGSAFLPPSDYSVVGIALATLKMEPIYGMREELEDNTASWFFWGGPQSMDPDFFQPVHVAHLADLLPMVLPYLALEPGFRFVIDTNGYEDVYRET